MSPVKSSSAMIVQHPLHCVRLDQCEVCASLMLGTVPRVYRAHSGNRPMPVHVEKGVGKNYLFGFHSG